MSKSTPRREYEYIVVGSGAGGGTVAARLAEAGRRVLLLEAGGDPLAMQGGDPIDPGGKRLPEDYEVPAFQALASENEAMKWDFWVRHYASDELQQRDWKYRAEWDGKKVDGILYPRAGTLGGCTAHNAMIMIYPHNADWDRVADITGDPSWKADSMRKYYERMEDCHYRSIFPPYRWLAKLFGWNPTRHGFGGWLSTEVALPKAILGDEPLVKVLLRMAKVALKKVGQPLKRALWLLEGEGDHNDWRLTKANSVGVRYAPIATRNHARNGTREFVLDVVRKFPGNLTLELDALATRVLFDDDHRAIGVEYLKGARLYRAFYRPSDEPGEKQQVYASKEVILAGGAYNTPQLLMLSGIGPKAELEKYGIEVRVDLPGVGENLQDRYEVTIVNRMKEPWDILKGATFSPGDTQYEQWQQKRAGVYTTNGAALVVIKRSDPARPLPDLFIFALLGKFPGYFPGYSKDVVLPNYLTWAILKAHTNNTAGTVKLASADPLDTPDIDFHYFEEGNDPHEEDLESVVDAVKFVREMTAQITGSIEEEELPGKDVISREQMREFVKNQAWGHHCSCTCKIGRKDDPMAVLDGDFRVYGTQGLRVVDASVFPRIPGFFIVTSVYMVGEKAADVILRDSA